MPSKTEYNSFRDVELHKKLEDYLQKRQKRIFNNLNTLLTQISPFPQIIKGKKNDSFSYTYILEEVVSNYKGNEYRIMNLAARNPEHLDPDEDDHLLGYLNSVIMSFITRYGAMAPIDMTLYRGLSFMSREKLTKFMNNMVPGQPIVNREFMSMTPQVHTAFSFASTRYSVILILSLPKGTPMYVYTFFLQDWEPEVVLPNCAKWIVDKVEDVDEYRSYVYLHLSTIGTMRFDVLPKDNSKLESSVPELIPVGKGKYIRKIDKSELITLYRYIYYYYMFRYKHKLVKSGFKGSDIIKNIVKQEFLAYKKHGGCHTFEEIKGYGVPTSLLKKLSKEKGSSSPKSAKSVSFETSSTSSISSTISEDEERYEPEF